VVAWKGEITTPEENNQETPCPCYVNAKNPKKKKVGEFITREEKQNPSPLTSPKKPKSESRAEQEENRFQGDKKVC